MHPTVAEHKQKNDEDKTGAKYDKREVELFMHLKAYHLAGLGRERRTGHRGILAAMHSPFESMANIRKWQENVVQAGIV